MPRLYRPNIPLKVKAQVLIRQRGYLFPEKEMQGALLEGLAAFVDRQKRTLAALLHCDVKDLRLDHDPALGARARTGDGKHTVYDPPANSPDHLIYREKHAHHLKTNVRGDGAQYPDRVLIRRERKRLAEKTAKSNPMNKIRNKMRRNWRSRPLQSASRWPSGRKIENRRKP